MHKGRSSVINKSDFLKMSAQVTLPQGFIQGEQRTAYDGTKYYSFEGIPYAKPPVGQLRFRDPQPPDSWHGIRDGTKPGNKCAQYNIYSLKDFEGSEDCLYLNVYTPRLPAEEIQKLPVLFFIHGGRLAVGYGDYYQPDYFMRHNVILVTFNYRLNILGFLSLDTPEVPGNAGLKDCIFALRWVKSNIEVFNGNSNNITLFGESAGGAICTGFVCSKMAAGLFQKVISQSGNHVGDVFMFVQDHIAVAKRVAATLGKEIEDTKELLDYFRSVPVEELVKAYTFSKNDELLNPLLMTVVEKEFSGVECFMHELPLDSFVNNRFIKVPTIIGSNLYEGAAFVFKDENGIHYKRDLREFVPSQMYLKDDDPRREEMARKIKEYYFKDKTIGDETKVEYMRMLSDAYFDRDIMKLNEILAKHNVEVYVYKFKYVGNLNIRTMKNLGVHGTTHGDCIQYQFYRKNHDKKTNERDKKIVDFFSEAFTSFAKNSKPTWKRQEVEWVPYTQQDKMALVVDESMSLVKHEDWDSYKFWTELCSERAKL